MIGKTVYIKPYGVDVPYRVKIIGMSRDGKTVYVISPALSLYTQRDVQAIKVDDLIKDKSS